MNRVEKLSNHISASPCNATQRTIFGKIGETNDNDVVIVGAVRTAIAKARKGSFKNTTPDDLLVGVFKGLFDKTGVDPKDIDDVCVGNVQLSGAYSLPARTAMFRAGIPESASVRAVNRQCSSGSQAIADIAAQIATGQIDIGIGSGVESMTLGGNPGDPSSIPPMNMNEIFSTDGARECLTPMGVTSENVAKKFNITRKQQDEFALGSVNKALNAIETGKFKEEIIPLKVIVEDKEGNESEVTASVDEGPRKGTTLEKLGKLRPAFDPKGSSTAGNSSQTSDGASACLLMTRKEAKKRNLKILGTFRGAKVVGVNPGIMGIGPAAAIPAVLKDCGVTVNDIEVFEINEAFASQAIYCVEHLKIPIERVNPNGGAIALGHPLGCTGSRMTATLLHELNRRKKSNKPSIGIVSMCIGTGMGHASIFEV